MDDQREKDVLTLCNLVLNVSPNYWDNPNGAYESTCPFCWEQVWKGGQDMFASMDEIKHKPDCAYLIAKDLSTNLI
jgi:hypothetical protein